MVEIASLEVGDPPSVWSDLGFTVEGEVCVVGAVTIHLTGPAGDKGIGGWALRGATLAGSLLDGIATVAAGDDVAGGPPHANGVRLIDHLVVTTPDLDRTTDALAAAGLQLRRRRETEKVVQHFFRMGDVILEVVGGPSGSPGATGPARLWGLAFTVADLDATAATLGDRLHQPKTAVQPGRRIATLDRRAGSSLPLAFMSPEP